MAFSADGATVVGASPYHTVRVWDLTPPSCTCVPPLNTTITTSPATSVAFSPDGVTLATGNADGTVRLWDVATGNPIGAPLTGPAGRVTSVALSRDGETLAAGSADGTVRVWDMATHRQITALTGPGGAVNSVAFSPGGTTLATGSADHTVRLWDVAYLVSVVPHLCASARRSLTRAEWARYVPGLPYQRVCP